MAEIIQRKCPVPGWIARHHAAGLKYLCDERDKQFKRVVYLTWVILSSLFSQSILIFH